MSTFPSLLAAVETLMHIALPWHCPWMKRRLRDGIVAILVGQTVVIRSLAATLQSIDPAASSVPYGRECRIGGARLSAEYGDDCVLGNG